MANQPILGYPSSYRAPFTAVEINFAQGPSTSDGPGRGVLYCAPKTSAGNWTVGTVYRVRREQDAVEGAGAGSFLHRQIRMHLLADKNATLYALPYAASSASGIATATGTITVGFDSGSNPTATGLITTVVCGEEITTSFSTSSTATTIADTIVAQVNAKTWLPVTASNVAGVITLTAKTAGASSGDGTTGVLRFRSRVEPGKNVTIATSGAALGLGTGTPGADGSTTETANLTAALAGITASRYYYMGFSVWTAAAIAPIKTHVVSKSEPNPGLRCRAWTGYTGTQSGLTTLANACNYERRHFVHQENSDHDPSELVANVIAIHRKRESFRGGFVHDLYREPDWLIRPAYAESDWPTGDEVNEACVDGITVIGSDTTGSYLVMSLNSRSKNSSGTIDDFRATETHRVSFMDDLADTWLARHQVTYAGFKLKADRKRPDGTVDVNQTVAPRTVTPSNYRPFLAGIIQEFANDGVIQDPEVWIEAIQANVDPLNNGRLELGDAGRTMDLLHQTTLRLSELSAG
jgi:phage tail sheath gpL-like